ncbi:glycosyltransferase [Lentzea sp. E54]|uniref:glycosyltransferase n=1 Tax=Lentzea xerophila TaxID=3435883 RepID=UPI003DA46642
MKVSVVIPARDEATRVGRALQALCVQRTRYEFDVIVVDNASADATAEVALSWSDELDLLVVHEPRAGRGSARRRGFELTTSEIVLSTDADTVVPDCWVESMVDQLLARPSAAAVTTASYINDGTRITNVTMRIGMALAVRIYRVLFGHHTLLGASFAVRRSCYEAAGGFSVRRDAVEDAELAMRLCRFGEIVHLRQPKVETSNNVFREGLVKAYVRYTRQMVRALVDSRHRSRASEPT